MTPANPSVHFGSGMRAGYSTLSVEPAFKVLADSAPYCLFRNKENYQYNPVGDQKPSHSAENKRTEDQVRLYNDCLADAYVPSYLLYGALRRDASAHRSSKQDQSWSTIAPVQHDHRRMFAHVSGRHMDKVVLRDAAHSFTGLDLRNPPGFTLALGAGSPVHEIVHAGTTHWGSSSLLLARTRAEVFQLRTVSLDEAHTKPSDRVDSRPPANVLTTMLDPVQKWQLPHEICSTSTSPSTWNAACFLTACGRVCTWSPSEGVQLAAGGASVLPADRLAPGMRDYSMRIDCTLHPQVSHIACDKEVFLFDLRAASAVATKFYSTGDLRVLSTKQHGGAAQCFLVSTRDCVSLVDTRYTRTPLAQQYIPAGHEKMKYFANPLKSQSGLFLGASRGSPQLFAHTFEHGGGDGSLSGPVRDAHEAAQRLLSASRACGSEEAVRWDVDGFPVVDAGSSAEASLLGFELISLSQHGSASREDGDGDVSALAEAEERSASSSSGGEESDSSDDSDPRARFERRRRAARKPKKVSSKSSHQQQFDAAFPSSSSRSAPTHSALLLQQSHRGDVFAQRVSWSANPYRNARLGLSISAAQSSSGAQRGSIVGRLSMGGASSVAAAVANRKAPARKLKRKRPLHHRGGGSDDESEESSSEGEEQEEEESHRKSAVASQQQLSSQVSQRQHQADQQGAVRWSGLPPVQLQLPCGVRCHPSERGNLLDSTDAGRTGSDDNKRDSALKATKKYLKTIIRNNGLILQNAISVRDSNPSDPQNASHIYPSPSSAFLDFIPEDTLHGFDVIKMYPEDLRVDLPTLPSHTALVMKQTSAAVNARSAVEYIVQHYKVELLAYLKKESKTLWEIWKFLLVKTEGKRLEINHLRQSLRSNCGLVETRVPTSGPHTTETGAVKVRRERGSDQDSDGSPASSDLDTSPTSPSSSQHKTNRPVRPQTFDGLYVREPNAHRASREVYRDNSKGHELRMGRRPAPTEEEENAVVQWGCSCAAVNSQNTDLAKLALCGEKCCIIPHTLVFRIDKSPTTGDGVLHKGSRAGASAKSKPAAEAFYWGSSLAPRTVPTSSLPPKPTLSQSQTQSQPMSQLRFQLSQVSQNSQTPFAQPSQSFTPAPRAPATTPGTKAPVAPEPSLDVTDSMLAVLSNNWNRSLDHTAYVDPAQTSLLQAWAPR